MEWVVIPFPGDLLNPQITPAFFVPPALASGLFATSTTWETTNHKIKSLSCPKTGFLKQTVFHFLTSAETPFKDKIQFPGLSGYDFWDSPMPRGIIAVNP